MAGSWVLDLELDGASSRTRKYSIVVKYRSKVYYSSVSIVLV